MFHPDGALPLFIGGGDHEVVRGCKKGTAWHTPNYSLYSHPLTAKAVPIDFASLIFLLLVRHSTNKFVLCSYFVRRFPL